MLYDDGDAGDRGGDGDDRRTKSGAIPDFGGLANAILIACIAAMALIAIASLALR